MNDPMLPRVGTGQVEHRGLAILKEILTSPATSGGLGFLFREVSVLDFGIDGQLEIVAEGDKGLYATGKILSVQLKTGKSYFAIDDGPSWSIYVPARTVNYWRAHSVPVILVLLDPDKRNAFWVRADSEEHVATGESFRIRVPKNQPLDRRARESLASLAENTTAEGRRMAELEAMAPVISAAVRGEHVVLDLLHWHNKSSGRMDFWLGASAETEQRSEPREMTTFMSGSIFGTGGDPLAVAQHLAPWAQAQTDDVFEEAAREELYNNYLAETGTWDSEDQVYIDSRGTFDDYIQKREDAMSTDLLAYEVDGEFARYRIALKPNDLARAFVCMRRFLSDTPSSDEVWPK